MIFRPPRPMRQDIEATETSEKVRESVGELRARAIPASVADHRRFLHELLSVEVER